MDTRVRQVFIFSFACGPPHQRIIELFFVPYESRARWQSFGCKRILRIAALISVAAITALQAMGGSFKNIFNTANNALVTAG